jgi:hypothetical protein
LHLKKAQRNVTLIFNIKNYYFILFRLKSFILAFSLKPQFSLSHLHEPSNMIAS